MKKKVIVLLVIMAMLFVSACGSKEKPAEENKPEETEQEDESGKEEGKEEGGSTEEADDVYYTPESGMTIPASKTYNENKDKVYLYYYGGMADDELYFAEYFLYPATYDQLNSMSDSEFEEADSNAVEALLLLRVLDEAWTKEDLDKWCKWMLDFEEGTIQELKKEDGYTVYYYIQKELGETLAEDLKPVFQGVIADMEAAKDQLVLTKPETISDYINGMIVEFETTDLDGNPVSSKEIFAKNKYTMINIWASWCGPCISEMPELEELNKVFQEKGCGIIGVLGDGKDAQGLADGKEIVADTGVTYLNVIDSMGLQDTLMIQAYPTSVFVDSEGRVVGEAVVGAMITMYESVLDELLGE